MCGILGAWSPPSQDRRALEGLKISAELGRASKRRIAGSTTRHIARWSWPDRNARWSDVTHTLGDAISSALQALEHRGPDGAGFYLSPCCGVWLAHTRLAIRGAQGAQPLGFNPTQHRWSAHPTPSDQPLFIDRSDTSLWASVNGELYQRSEGKVSKQAHTPTTHSSEGSDTYSDATHLLRCYHQRGVLEADPALGESHSGLRGEYAFALWDEHRARLWLGRDPFGVKPLVYAWRSGRLYFASEAKALFALGLKDLKPHWNFGSLERSLLYQYLPPARTYFDEVSTLPPGGSLIVSERGDRLEVTPINQIHHVSDTRDADTCNERRDEGRDERDRKTYDVSRLKSALLEATALRLNADVPICFQLSGGLDSSAILGAARDLGVTRPVAFSLVFDDDRYNEATQAREVASALGADWRPVNATRARLLDALSDSVFYGEGICINGQLPAKRLLCAGMGEDGIRVCLSGEGADEALLGYPHLMRDAYPESYQSLAHHQPQTASVMLSRDPSSIPIFERLWGYTPHFLSAKFNLLAPLRDLFDVEVFRGDTSLSIRSKTWDLLPAELLMAQSSRPDTPIKRARRSMWTWTRLCLANYILRGIGDGMEMASSIEGRPVYLDPRLFNIATHQATLRLGHEKTPLRVATRGLIPEVARLAPKRSLLAPPLSVPMGHGDQGLVQRALSISATEWSKIPGLSPSRTRIWLESLASSTAAERAAIDVPLMMLMSLYELNQRFNLKM